MIVILAPYGRTETTRAAVRLADLAVGLGREVRLVSVGTHEKAVHPLWDDRVRCGRKDGVYRAAAKATHVVHFQACRRLLAQARLVTDGKVKARHIVVPDWHGLSDLTVLPEYDQVVCPSKACHRVVHQEAFNGKNQPKARLSWVRWEPGVAPVKRDGLVSTGRLRACVYCDASAVDLCAPTVTQLAFELLGLRPKLDLTVLAAKGWADGDRRALGRVAAAFPGRLVVKRVGSLPDVEREFHGHDWAILPSVRADFGLTAATAMACGTPVICHDIPPYAEVVPPDAGIRVECEVRAGAAKAPIAVPQLGKWLTACAAATADSKALLRLQGLEWGLDAARHAFQAAWVKTWET